MDSETLRLSVGLQNSTLSGDYGDDDNDNDRMATTLALPSKQSSGLQRSLRPLFLHAVKSLVSLCTLEASLV